MNTNLDVMKFLELYGLKGFLFLSIIVIIGSVVKSEWFGKWLSKVSDKFVERFMRNKTKSIDNQVRNITDSDITNHDIFNYIDFWMYSKVPTFQFSTEYRTAVFRKYLSIYLRNYKNDISSFVTSKKYQTMDQAEIWRELLNLINTIVYDYEREMI